MKLYSKYILKKTSTTFLGITTILICLIWFSRAISFVKYVTDNGIKLSDFFYLFILILPWILQFIIPVSLLIAILMTYNRLINSNEITILKNSGLTKIGICRPIGRLAMLCTLFCYFISMYLMPLSNKELRISRINIANNYTSLSFNSNTFETINNITIYANKRDEKNNLYGIMLHDQRNKEYSLTITAQEGNIIIEENSALLYMQNGTIQRFNYANSKSEILHFDDYVFNLTETKTDKQNSTWKARERYLPELINPKEEISDKKRLKFWVEIHERIIYPLLPILFALISLSSILQGSFNRRGNNKNIMNAIILNVAFFALLMTSLSFVEKSMSLTPLPYIVILIFTALPIIMLRSNYRKKAK